MFSCFNLIKTMPVLPMIFDDFEGKVAGLVMEFLDTLSDNLGYKK